MRNIEAQISENKEKYRLKVESKVINSIKEDPSVFYRYARQKSKTRCDIGPLMKSDKTITSDDGEMSNILSQQYAKVFSKPFYDITSDDFTVKLSETVTNVNSEICEIYFTAENIKSALKNIDNSSSAGQDGVPPHVLKCGGKFVRDALYDIGMTSMDSDIPDKLRMMWISPTNKPNIKNN